MILVDTSIWVEFLSKRQPKLARLLGRGLVATHPFVIGEVLMGSLSDRAAVERSLRALPGVEISTESSVIAFVAQHALHGQGIGWIDAHLLMSSVTHNLPLWTRDRKLAASASKLRVLWG